MAIAWICINCNAELMEDDDIPHGEEARCWVCQEKELIGSERDRWYRKFEKKEHLVQVGGLDDMKEFDEWT
jgi:DNA-directed RNA polymerase subunit RPC12/RpoP